MAKKAAADPVAKRRGVDPDLTGSWDNVLLHGDVDQWVAALKRTGATVRASDEVTKQALAGKLVAPKRSKRLVLVQLRGHAWLLAGMIGAGDDTAEAMAKQTKLRAMQVGYGKVSGTTYAKVFDGGELVVNFEAGDEFFFHSKAHPPGWKKQFREDEDALLDAIVRGEGAFVPGFWASESNGKVHLQCGQDDVLTPENVQRVAIIVLATSRQEEAEKLLSDAVHKCEPDGVREALRLGANPHDPFHLRSAIRWIVGGLRPPQALEVFDLLVAAGAELNGHRKPNSPPPAVSHLCDISAVPEEPGIVAAIDALHRAGADLNVIGVESKRSPMSFAAACGSLKAIQRLERLGLDPTARDGSRKLPLQRAAEARGDCEWAPEVFRKRMKRLDAVIAYLSSLGGKEKPARAARAGSIAASSKTSRPKPRRR
ncbi:MAG: hypothetical protein WBD40_16675 [Tepidisphaeraceae bacterium]